MKNLFIYLTFFATFYLFAENYHIYELELVYTFPNGSENGMINAYKPPNDPTSPSGMRFNRQGEIFFVDIAKKSILNYSSDFSYHDRIPYPYYLDGLSELDNNHFISFSVGYLSIVNRRGESEFFIDGNSLIHNLKSYVFYEMNSFFYDEDGNIYCIPDPGPDYADFDSQKAKLYKNEEVISLFDIGSDIDMKGLSIDEEYNLFDSTGELLVRDYGRFVSYWSKQHTVERMNPPPNYFDVSFDVSKVKGLQYLGDDRKGNTYWFSNMYFYIFSEEGWMIDIIKIDYNKAKTNPAIHPNGDIYLLDFDKENVYLYKIPNTWDPFDWQSPATTESYPTARVNSGGLRVRDNPVTSNSTVLGKLNLNQNVEILGQSADELTIDGLTAPWYKIRTSDGLEGWVFGGYLDLE